MKSFLLTLFITCAFISQSQNQIIEIDCDAGIGTFNYCYDNNEDTTFTFSSLSGAPVIIEFTAGTIETFSDELIIYDGLNNGGTVLFSGDNGGDLSGLTFQSTGDSIFMELDSDGSVSCESGSQTEWAIEYRCSTCTPATVNYNVVSDCVNGDQFFIEVDIPNIGDAASVLINDDQGSAEQTTTAAGDFTFGPYANGTQVIITVADADDDNCILMSNSLGQDFCPAQSCDIINAGFDQEVGCDSTGSVELSATFMTSAITTDTSNYSITDLECPLQDLEGTPSGLDIDDRWSQVIDLGFDFSFFGTTYSQILIGANGVLTFNLGDADQFCPWSFEPDELVPTPELPLNAIFGAYHDIDPNEGGTIEYTTVGVAPQRQFKVSFVHVPHFSCTELLTTQQIILYESSNVIDVIVEEKPVCQTWNDGLAVIGLQNDSGTVGYTPAGRNTGSWAVTFQELWRFLPDGEPNYVFEWFDDEGASLGNDTDISVNPTETSTYTASVTYTDVNNQTSTVTDDITVIVTGGASDAGEPNDLAVCDGQGQQEGTVYDLTVQDSVIINGQADVTVTYYENEADAVAGNNAIPNPSMYESFISPQTIFFLYQSDENPDCSATGSFDLIQIETPVAGEPDSLIICSDGTTGVFDLTTQDAIIINGQTDVNVTYYENETDAINGNNAITNPSAYTSTSSPQTVFFVLQSDGNADCSDNGSFDLIQDVSPIAGQPENLSICATGPSSIFDLTEQDAIIIDGQQDITLSYYESEADALAGNNAITNPSMYESTTSPQTIFFVLQSTTNTDCTDSGSFDLIQTTTPVAGEPDDLIICTDGTSGIFDLTAQNAIIIDGQSNVTVSYHQNEADAMSGDNAITNPTAYESTSSPETIFFLLQSDDNADCFDTGSFNLIQDILPVAGQPEDLTECSTGTTSIFDLSVQDAIIINGQADVSVSYYETEADALTGDSPITDPSNYESTTTTQTIFFQLQSDTNENCIDTGSFDLIQTMTPVAGTPDDLTICSTGTGIFDLTAQDAIIIDGQSDVTVTYHETEDDAIVGDNPITNASMYENTSNPQTIYFLLQSNLNPDCFDTGSFMLIEVDQPIAGQAEDLTNCSNASGNAIFDLTSQNGLVINGQTDVSVSYFTSQADADTGTNPIVNPDAYENLTSPQTIYYRIENINASECFDTGSFTLFVSTFDTNLVAFDQGCEADNYEITVLPIDNSFNPATVTYEWSGPIGASVTNSMSQTFVATVDGEYFVDITTAEGCVYTVSTTVVNAMCVFPQGISPNNDNLNDTFDLSAFNVSELEIFNRQGKSVYRKQNYTNEWIGQSDNGDLPVGTYFYVARLADDETRNGWIYIQR